MMGKMSITILLVKKWYKLSFPLVQIKKCTFFQNRINKQDKIEEIIFFIH